MALRRAANIAAFVRDPIGTWVIAGTTMLWCPTPTLIGAAAFGRPGPEESRVALSAYEALHSVAMAHPVDVVLDSRRLEVDLDALAVLVSWLRDNLARYKPRIRLQVGLVADDHAGVLLSGLLPFLGQSHPFRVFTDPHSAFADVRGGSGALADEIDSITNEAIGLPVIVSSLRTILRERRGDITLAEAARRLAMSPRSLQRLLGTVRSSFGDEQRDARWTAAHELLINTRDKVSAIANRLGISERTLTRIVRERSGQSPEELRRSHGGDA